jgi:hypothetical protein
MGRDAMTGSQNGPVSVVHGRMLVPQPSAAGKSSASGRRSDRSGPGVGSESGDISAKLDVAYEPPSALAHRTDLARVDPPPSRLGRKAKLESEFGDGQEPHRRALAEGPVIAVMARGANLFGSRPELDAVDADNRVRCAIDSVRPDRRLSCYL